MTAWACPLWAGAVALSAMRSPPQKNVSSKIAIIPKVSGLRFMAQKLGLAAMAVNPRACNNNRLSLLPGSLAWGMVTP